MKSIHEILITRDGMKYADAQELIDQAKEQMFEYLDEGDIDSAENICQEFFGLEPDYLDQLLY